MLSTLSPSFSPPLAVHSSPSPNLFNTTVWERALQALVFEVKLSNCHIHFLNTLSSHSVILPFSGDPDDLENGKPSKKRAKTATNVGNVDPDEDVDSMDSNSTPKAADATDGAVAATTEGNNCSGCRCLNEINVQ